MQRTTPHTPISGKDNITIKNLRSLTETKHRKKEHAFLIEGVKIVEEALRDDAGVTMVIAAPALVQHHGKGVLKLAESRGIDVLWISDRLMDALSESKTPQPVMAVVKMKLYSEESLLADAAGLIVIAHQLQDPGNLGTIIRTAEAANASGVAITANTVDPYNAKAIRASMGSILRLPIVFIGNTMQFLATCKERGFQTAAMVLTGEKAYFDVDLTKPTVVLLGQEGAGLPQDIDAGIDLRVRIPMAKTIDSLNVATAAALVLYEMMRQRK
jgi:TrmH family RNA methyltransferase